MAYRRPSHSVPPNGDASASTNSAIAYPFTNGTTASPIPRRGPIEGPYGKLTRRVTWRSTTYKLAAYLWVLGVLYLCWLIRPLFYLPFSSDFPDKIPMLSSVNEDYFAIFYGRTECGISSLDLYKPPVAADTGKLQRNAYCPNRNALLKAMSLGGRQDFDTPFESSGCHHRWYSTAEICMILERFDHILFVGDESLLNVYAAFNMLLSEDIAYGSLKQWKMTPEQLASCSCDNQYLNRDCMSYLINSSEDVYEQNSRGRSRYPYACSARIPHSFFPATGSPTPEKDYEAFRNIVMTPVSRGSKSIPVVLAGPSQSSPQEVTESMDRWTSMARAGVTNSPFLWIGPAATSPKSSGLSKDQELGDNVKELQDVFFSRTEARSRGMEVLGMYNATLKASSWDGHSYGESVSLLQAMMVINWLARL